MEVEAKFRDPEKVSLSPVQKSPFNRVQQIQRLCEHFFRTKWCVPQMELSQRPEGGGVLPRILDRGVPRRFVNPNPI